MCFILLQVCLYTKMEWTNFQERITAANPIWWKLYLEQQHKQRFSKIIYLLVKIVCVIFSVFLFKCVCVIIIIIEKSVCICASVWHRLEKIAINIYADVSIYDILYILGRAFISSPCIIDEKPVSCWIPLLLQLISSEKSRGDYTTLHTEVRIKT